MGGPSIHAANECAGRRGAYHIFLLLLNILCFKPEMPECNSKFQNGKIS